MQRLSHYRQAILTAILGTLITFAVAATLYYQDNQQIRADLSAEAGDLQREIRQQLQTHMFGINWVARHNARHDVEQDAWLRDGETMLAYYRYFRYLLWMNQELEILSSYPDHARVNLSNEGRLDDELATALSNLAPGQRYLLPAGSLSGQDADVLMVIPQQRQNGGYYVGVIDMFRLLNATVAEHISDHTQFRIIDLASNRVVFDFSSTERLRDNWGGELEFRVLNKDWRMELWPAPERLSHMRSRMPLLILLAGGVTTALLTFVLYVLGVSRVRAQELADTNLDLYVEIEERERVEKKMAYLAEHDWLTDLANRNALMERLEDMFRQSKLQRLHVGVLFIDLDNFKEVNDALGHSVGDELLKRVAGRLTKLLPEQGCLARMGGDEFVVAMPMIASPEVLEQFAQQTLDALDTHFYVDDYEIFISGSIGVALSDRNDTPESLIRNADTALYRAKERGRNVYHIYSEALHERLNTRMELMKRLRHAVEREKLTVYYQPKVDMTSRRIVGVEALVRWIDDDGSVIGPDDFIPIAEDTGLIIPISDFVMRTACEQLAHWRQLGFPDLNMSVNLSGKQLQSPDLIDHIMQIVDNAGIPAQNLELELTEQVFIENIQSHTNFMHAVRQNGIALAIDDFGIGYSSLSYLKHFPVNALKIDRSFVRDLPDDKDDATLTQTIINLAKSLDIGLVAEGVETEAQVDFLVERDCIIAQGYLFSRPVPAHEFTQLLTEYEGQIPFQIM